MAPRNRPPVPTPVPPPPAVVPPSPPVVPIPGSDRAPSGPEPHGRVTGAAPPDEAVHVTVKVRPAIPLPPTPDAGLTREQYEALYGSSQADLDAVVKFAAAHALTVDEVSAGKRAVKLSGTVAQVDAAFGVALQRATGADGTYRTRQGEIFVPAELAGVVEGVFGLDDRPLAAPHFRPPPVGFRHHAGPAAYTAPQLARIYNFPADVDGAGQCIAIISLGGGYKVRDLQEYFALVGVPMPTVKSVSVDGAGNKPGSDADGENVLDIQVSGGSAPGATVVVYHAPNTDRGFVDAITTAVHDKQYKPSVISVSWGAPERSWTGQALKAMHAAFQAAAAMGVTVLVASGDNGSSDGLVGRNADYPSSDPYVLGCGGTSLVAGAGGIVSETVWNNGPGGGATGGGVSAVFARPDYQAGVLQSNARGVPDWAGVADPATGHVIRLNDTTQAIGGTSAVAPLLAGLVARLNQALGKPVGLLHPKLYGAGACRDIVTGDNGDYHATSGFDLCTGNGVPDGMRLLAALGGGAPVVPPPVMPPVPPDGVVLELGPEDLTPSGAAKLRAAGLVSFVVRAG